MRQGSKPLKHITIGLFLAATTLAIILGSIELVGFIWERRTAQGPFGWNLVASRRMPVIQKGSSSQPYFLLYPNKNYLWEGIPVKINSHGFRTKEFATSKSENTYRILNLGDSIVFGWGIQEWDTYGNQLEHMLNENGGDLNYEVINAGIPGWNLEAERNFLLQEGLNYQPDLVILDLTLVNDIYGRGPDSSEAPTILKWLRDHTYGWSFLTTHLRYLLSGKKSPEAFPVLNPPKNEEAYFPLTKDDPVWDRVWGYIIEMHEISQQRAIDFIVIAFPTALQLNSEGHSDIPQRILKQRAVEDGVEILDMLPIYRQECEETKHGSCEGFKNILFADIWMHPNALGHRLAAESLVSTLDLN